MSFKRTTKKNRGGRPKESVSDKIDFGEVERLAGLGLSDTQIGTMLGITQPTVSKYKKECEEFHNALKTGRTIAVEMVATALLNKAVLGEDVAAQIFFLKNRAPEQWLDRKEIIQHSTIHQPTMDLGKLTTGELRDLKAFINKAIEQRTVTGPPSQLRAAG